MTRANEVLYFYNVNREFAEELEQMVLVAHAGTGGGYDWDEVYVFWHTRRERFYYISDSGCSCNSITDGLYGLGDFLDFATKGEVIRHFTNDRKPSDYGWSRDDINSMINEIMNWRG